MTKVAVVDDHSVVLAGLKFVLSRAEGMEVGLMQGAKGLYETASAISLETAETLGSISTRGVNYASAHSMNYGDRLDRLLDAVERLADSQTTMEIDGRPFGRLVRSQAR